MAQQTKQHPPIILQIVGYKNTGKTTWVCRLTEIFKRAGYRVGTIKHDGHDFQMDQPGTDTWRHQAAGADITAISSSQRTAILKQQSQSLEELITAMADAVDVIFIEGYKNASYPKVILIRDSSHFTLALELSQPIALALWPDAEQEGIQLSRKQKDPFASIPQITINDYEKIIPLLIAWQR